MGRGRGAASLTPAWMSAGGVLGLGAGTSAGGGASEVDTATSESSAPTAEGSSPDLLEVEGQRRKREREQQGSDHEPRSADAPPTKRATLPDLPDLPAGLAEQADGRRSSEEAGRALVEALAGFVGELQRALQCNEVEVEWARDLLVEALESISQ